MYTGVVTGDATTFFAKSLVAIGKTAKTTVRASANAIRACELLLGEDNHIPNNRVEQNNYLYLF